MQVKSWITTIGIGAAAGAAAVLLLPKSSPVYRKADQAVHTIKDEAVRIIDRMR